MTDLHKAAQQALEALEAGLDVNPILAGEAEEALRAALAQQAGSWQDGVLEGHLRERERWLAQEQAEPKGGGRLPPPLQAEPVEPVAWMCPEDPERETAFNWKAGHCENCGKQRIPLYTAPPQRKPLTKEEIMRAFYAAEKTTMSIRHGLSVVESARIVERAHGIKE